MAIKNARRPDFPGWPEKPIADLQSYLIRADQIGATSASTGELELFSLPAGTLIEALYWAVPTAWTDSQQSNPVIYLGSTGDRRQFGELGAMQLGSTGNGAISVMFESTGESKVCAYIVTVGAKPVAPTAGTLDIWMKYRPNSESQRWINST